MSALRRSRSSICSTLTTFMYLSNYGSNGVPSRMRQRNNKRLNTHLRSLSLSAAVKMKTRYIILVGERLDIMPGNPDIARPQRLHHRLFSSKSNSK